MDLEERLRTHLHDHSAGVGFDGHRPDDAVERHERRQYRHRMAGSAVALIALVGAVVVVVGTGDEPVETVAAGGPGSGDAEFPVGDGSAPIARSAGLEWRVEPAELSGYPLRTHEIDGLFYALSTSPGVTDDTHPSGNYPRSIYRSDNGTSWDEVIGFDDPWIADLGDGPGELLYAVGTAPATTAAGTAGAVGLFGTSTDGGRTWTQAALPSTATEPDPTIPVTASYLDPRMGVSGGTAVVSLVTSYLVDYEALVPDDYWPSGRSGDFGWAATDAGLELYDGNEVQEIDEARCATPIEVELHAAEDPGESAPEEMVADCVTEPEVFAVVPWSELPIDGPRPFTTEELFISTGGADFEAVAWPFGDGQVFGLDGTADGFVASVLTYRPAVGAADDWTMVLWTSIDGRSWTPAPAPFAGIYSAGAIGGSLAVVGTEADGHREGLAVSLDNGATWATRDLGELLGDTTGRTARVVFADVTEAGILIVVDTDDQERTVLHSIDGRQWSSTRLSSLDLPADSWPTSGFVADDGTVYLGVESFVDGQTTRSVLVGT